MIIMERVHLETGDWAWIYAPGHKGDRTRHKVVHTFDLNGERMYVIEVDTHIDPIYEVRSGMQVSDAKKKPIGLFRGLVSGDR